MEAVLLFKVILFLDHFRNKQSFVGVTAGHPLGNIPGGQ